MLVRRLTATDAMEYQTLRLAALSGDPTAFGSSFEEEASASLEAVAIRVAGSQDSAMFGAYESTVLVGTVGVGRESMLKLRHKSFIWGMYVAPGQRGRGIGTALLKAALSFTAASTGVTRVNLYVNAANIAAVSLYQSHGFVTYGTEVDAMLVNGSYHDELLMFCRIEA